eukprot:scaffold6793_cov101-Isochrysis_galbana.AAC.1
MHVARAEAIIPNTCLAPTDVRRIFESIMALPPLKLSKEQITKSGLRGHSFHGTLSDIARSIGENPRLPFTPSPDLAQGFNATELGEL